MDYYVVIHKWTMSVIKALLESKDDDLGAVVGPFTDSEVEVAVDLLSRKQTHMVYLERDNVKVSGVPGERKR